MADVSAWLDEIERVEYDDASFADVVRQEEAMLRAAGMLGDDEHLLVEQPPQPSMQLTAALSAFQAGNPASLIEWFNDGADGQINWCEAGDFEDCVAVASAHLDNPEGFCNVRHQDVCGGPPGSEGHRAELLRGTPFEFYSEDQPRDKGMFAPGGAGAKASSKDTTPAGTQDVVKAAAEQTLIDRVAAQGGITIQPLTGEIPTTGFIVGLHSDTPSITPAGEFYGGAGVEEIDRFLADNAAAFDDDNVYMGVWDDEDHGEVAVDLVVQVATEQAAIAMGRDQDQQSIYDVVNKHVIEVGGTGGRSG